MKKVYVIFAALFLFGCSEELAKKQVSIKTQNSVINYTLEVAKTPEQQQKGLMFRENLPQNSGMLFVFEPVRDVAMWMKNTLISLDMIFVDPQGKITCLKDNATPLSEEFIYCNQEVAAVIELNAGEIAKNNIAIGDVVTY